MNASMFSGSSPLCRRVPAEPSLRSSGLFVQPRTSASGHHHREMKPCEYMKEIDRKASLLAAEKQLDRKRYRHFAQGPRVLSESAQDVCRRMVAERYGGGSRRLSPERKIEDIRRECGDTLVRSVVSSMGTGLVYDQRRKSVKPEVREHIMRAGYRTAYPSPQQRQFGAGSRHSGRHRVTALYNKVMSFNATTVQGADQEMDPGSTNVDRGQLDQLKRTIANL